MTSFQLHSTLVGDETAATRVVFLHGLFGRGRNFTRIAAGLEPEAQSLMVDLPNHGRSAWTEHFDYDLFADIVANELVERGAGREPVTLIGHSMGGIVGPKVAQLIPDRIHAVVISASIAALAQGGEDFARDFIEKRLGQIAGIGAAVLIALYVIYRYFLH